MIKITLPLLEVTKPKILKPNEKDVQQMIIGEEACKKLVAEYKEPKPVVLGDLIIGKIAKLTYNEEKKTIMADIELFVQIGPAVNEIESTFLDTPQGKSLISIALEAGMLAPNFEKIKEFVENTKEKK